MERDGETPLQNPLGVCVPVYKIERDLSRNQEHRDGQRGRTGCGDGQLAADRAEACLAGLALLELPVQRVLKRDDIAGGGGLRRHLLRVCEDEDD